MICEIHTKVDYEIMYDKEKSYEIPFFNINYFKDKLTNVTIKLTIDYEYDTVDENIIDIVYLKYNENDVIKLMGYNKRHTIKIDLENNYLYYKKQKLKCDNLKLFTEPLNFTNIKYLNVKIKTDGINNKITKEENKKALLILDPNIKEIHDKVEKELNDKKDNELFQLHQLN